MPDEAVAEALRDNGMTCLGVQDKFPAVRESPWHPTSGKALNIKKHPVGCFLHQNCPCFSVWAKASLNVGKYILQNGAQALTQLLGGIGVHELGKLGKGVPSKNRQFFFGVFNIFVKIL